MFDKIEYIFYLKYRSMRLRCYSKGRKDYKLYGARGISCLWNNYPDFKNDMYASYLEHIKIFGLKDTQLDRIDVNGNYYKENCRWETVKNQTRNKRNNRYITYNGEKRCIADWAEKLGIHRQSLRYRLNNGWSVKNIITIPINHANRNGEERFVKSSKKDS